MEVHRRKYFIPTMAGSGWGPAVIVLILFFSISTRAEYFYFSNVPSDSDGVVLEVRWPYWNGYYYNTWFSANWTSSDGVSGYFYNGLALPAAGSPNPVETKQTLNWSFWPLSHPLNISDTIRSCYTSPNTFAMQTIGEGTILRSPGSWTGWRTNVWYRMAIRTWQPVNGAAHLGYAGTWMRDPVTGIWHHMATVQLPFSVTGIDGESGFQENAAGGAQPEQTDYRGCYYLKNGVWGSGNQFYVYDHAGAVENVGLIDSNTAVYYETCENNPGYTGTITNVGQSSPVLTITQPVTPTFDPILVTNCSAAIAGDQLLVQWQIPPTSSPQFSYQIDVYTNSNFTGAPAETDFDIAPEARQKLLNLGNVVISSVRLTIVDIFSQTNAPITLEPTNATLSAATQVPGAVNGLNFAYYQSASNYQLDSNTNWSAMPDFASLTPLLVGAVNGLDLTPRLRREGYAFNYTGYLKVPSNGLYAFTLRSDAGSKLYLDGRLVVDNDGLHSPEDQSGWIGLQAGCHALNVQYFCDTQSALFSSSTYFDTLSLSYKGPGLAETEVPDSAYYRVPMGSEPAISLSSPTNGAMICGASVPLSATVTPNGVTVNQVQFFVGDDYWGKVISPPYFLNSFFWANHDNPIRARLIYHGSNVIDSAINLVTTTNQTLVPWQLTQAFYHNLPDGANVQNGTYALIGDGFNLMTRPVNGDCTLVAHLAGLPGTAAGPDGSSANSGWQAGIILRGNTNMVPGYPWGLARTTPFTAIFGQVDGGAYYQDESMVNGGGGYSSGKLGGQKWFKIQRAGNTFTSSVSSDGTSWMAVRTNTLSDFSTTLYAGFFTYAGPSSNPNVPWAKFDNVRLTGNLPGPPGVSINPQNKTLYAGSDAVLTATPIGSAPFVYQWQYQGNNITGATNSTLTLTNLQPNDSGEYAVQLSNANGNASADTTLTVLTPSAPVAAILSNYPVGYWRLNETAGPTAYDAVGNLNGTGEGGIVFGVPGVSGTPFGGFEGNNLAAQFNGADSDISIPALNLTTTNFSITGWVKCNGPQTSWSGLVFSRSGGRGTGLMVANDGANLQLRYSWNDNGADYNFSTGLNLPTNGAWAFVALTIQPNRAIVYMATNSTLYSATNNVTNEGQTFSGNFYLGYDPNSASRRLNGLLDEIAIYNQTLRPPQISQMLAASEAAPPTQLRLSTAAGGSFVISSMGATGQTYTLLAASNLISPILWLPLATNIAGAAGALTFTDSPAANFPERFYRVALP